MKRIGIIGYNGFIGYNLIKFFSLDYKITIITREILNNQNELEKCLNNCEIIINLAGANIAQRWNSSYKRILYESRIVTTSKIIKAISSIEKKPELLITTSAIGIYDNIKTYDENGTFSNDFLSKLCQDWEKEALKARNDITKVSIFRLGVVLGKDGGAFKKMLLPFKLGLGGKIGSGKQAFSFIHIKDLLRAYEFVIENNYDGIFNLTAPNTTTNYNLTKALGNALNRPTFLTVPEFILKIIFGEGAKVLTDGQKAIPKRLLDLGFTFKYKTIQEVINNICKQGI